MNEAALRGLAVPPQRYELYLLHSPGNARAVSVPGSPQGGTVRTCIGKFLAVGHVGGGS